MLDLAEGDIVLADYRNPDNRYVLNHTTGAVRSGLPTGRHAVGVGDWKRLGLFRRHRVFLALYVFEGALWLRVGPLRVLADAPGVRLTRRIPFPFVRRLRVSQVMGPDLTEWFWFERLEMSEWPLFGDFVTHVLETLGDPLERARVTALWRASEAGLDVTDREVREALNARTSRNADR